MLLARSSSCSDLAGDLAEGFDRAVFFTEHWSEKGRSGFKIALKLPDKAMGDCYLQVGACAEVLLETLQRVWVGYFWWKKVL